MRSVLTVTHPAAVRLLTRGRSRWVLGAFLRGENSVAGAARELNLDLRLVHRDVGALLSAGLLQVVREQKRAGRAVKVCTATAPAFFVPFSATDAADFAELGGKREQLYDGLLDRASRRKFEHLHHEQGGGREWGVRLYLGPEGQVQVDTSYEGAELVDAAVRYQGPVGLLLSARTALRLTEAEEVQIELIRLLMRLRPISVQHEQNGTGQPFLLRLGLVGVSEDEAQGLQ